MNLKRSTPEPVQALNPEVIRAWRERNKLSTQDLAFILSVSKITVERWEQWDPADPARPKATPTGPAVAILQDLIKAENPEVQEERIKNAAQISAMTIGGMAVGTAVAGATIAGVAAMAAPLSAMGLAGFGLYQILKRTWEPATTCPNCKSETSAKGKFCPECGTKLTR